MRNKITYALTLSAIGIVINLVLGIIIGMLNIPLLFLDTLGTIIVAIILGPIYGAATGGLSNIVLGILTNAKSIPFALVNVAVGLIVGLIAYKKKYNIPKAILTGIILSVICPIIGTIISIYCFGGITGDFNDVIFSILKNSGFEIFSAAFIPRITSNIIDKIGSCLIAYYLINKLPKNILVRNDNN